MIMSDNKKKAVSVILSRIKPDGTTEDGPSMKPEENMDSGDEALRAIAEDIMQAFHNKSTNDLMEGLRAFFHELELEPHEEGPHTNDED